MVNLFVIFGTSPRSGKRSAAVALSAGLGLACLGGLAAPPLVAASWAQQTMQALGMSPATLYVVVTTRYHDEDFHTAAAAGIPLTHILFSTQLALLPPNRKVVILDRKSVV